MYIWISYHKSSKTYTDIIDMHMLLQFGEQFDLQILFDQYKMELKSKIYNYRELNHISNES